MKIFDRYIAVAVASSAGVVMLVLLALFCFAALVSELDDIGRGDYGFMHAGLFVLLSVPRLAYQLFPMVALLGAVLGLGALASSHELTAMRAAGLSLRRIAYSVGKVGLMLMLATTVLGEWVAPPAEEYASRMRSAAIAGRVALPTKTGLWVRDRGDYIHVRDALPDSSIAGVTVYDFEAGKLHVVMRARAGRYVDGAWLLTDVARSELAPERVMTAHFTSLRWESGFVPRLVEVVAVNPEALSLAGLYRYVGYLRANGLSAERYETALWNKVVAPVTTGVMVILALPFVFGPLRSVGVGQRILVGALTGIGFHLINQTFNHAGLVYGLPPLAAAAVPTVLALVAALVLLRRVR